MSLHPLSPPGLQAVIRPQNRTLSLPQAESSAESVRRWVYSSIKTGLLWESHPAQEVAESRFRTKRITNWVHSQVNEPIISLFVSFIEPV